MRKNDEPKSWRERYDEEEKAREVRLSSSHSLEISISSRPLTEFSDSATFSPRSTDTGSTWLQARMEAVLSKMRDQYSDHKAARGTVKSIDGATQEKRRKIGHYTAGAFSSAPLALCTKELKLLHHPARPKTLFEKARSHTKAITSIYAPKRRPTQYTTPSPVTRIARPPPKPVAVAPLPSSTSRLTDNLPPREKPKPAVTVVRSLKRPAPFPPSTSLGPSNATSPGPALPSRSTIRSMAPPRTMPRLPPTALPSSRPVPRPTSFSPPPSLQPFQHVATRTLPAVVSPPPTPFPSTTVGRPAPPKSSIFMPAKRRL